MTALKKTLARFYYAFCKRTYDESGETLMVKTVLKEL
jgi:hypothetical protein